MSQASQQPIFPEIDGRSTSASVNLYLSQVSRVGIRPPPGRSLAVFPKQVCSRDREQRVRDLSDLPGGSGSFGDCKGAAYFAAQSGSLFLVSSRDNIIFKHTVQGQAFAAATPDELANPVNMQLIQETIQAFNQGDELWHCHGVLLFNRQVSIKF